MSHGRPVSPDRPAVRRAAAALLALLALGLLTGGPAPAQEAEADTAEGAPAPADLYTPEQAERGEAAFRSHCAACHLSNQFRGGHFRARWGGRTAYDLVNQLRATMPMDNPGGLALEQYVDVAAFLFRLNRYEAGGRELPADRSGLKEIRIPPEEDGG